jgi:tight adherence protein C
MVLAFVFGIILLAAALFVLAELTLVPVRQRKASIERATSYGGAAMPGTPELPSARIRILTPLLSRLNAAILRVTPQGMVDSIRKRLVAAGLRTASPASFIAAKLAGGVLGLVAGAFLGKAVGTGVTSVLLAPAFAATLFILPDRLLATRLNRRKESIQAGLPDALDLLAVSVEAGLGLDGAIAVLQEHTHGPLADEFALTLSGMRVGEGRREALKKLSDRVDAPEMTSLTRAIIQSDTHGISLGRILRLQARDTRIKREAVAEEKANKLPIKMLFPTLFFIFPPLFLLILGPAFIEIAHTL